MKEKKEHEKFYAIYLCVNKFFMFTHSRVRLDAACKRRAAATAEYNNILCLFNSHAMHFVCIPLQAHVTQHWAWNQEQ